MVRAVYIILMIIYAASLVAYFSRYEISYRLLDVNPGIVNQRSLTYEEYYRLKDAESMMRRISSCVMWASIAFFFVSVAVSRIDAGLPASVPKFLMFVSGSMAIVLILVEGIHFIPTSPIR